VSQTSKKAKNPRAYKLYKLSKILAKTAITQECLPRKSRAKNGVFDISLVKAKLKNP